MTTFASPHNGLISVVRRPFQPPSSLTTRTANVPMLQFDQVRWLVLDKVSVRLNHTIHPILLPRLPELPSS